MKYILLSLLLTLGCEKPPPEPIKYFAVGECIIGAYELGQLNKIEPWEEDKKDLIERHRVLEIGNYSYLTVKATGERSPWGGGSTNKILFKDSRSYSKTICTRALKKFKREDPTL